MTGTQIPVNPENPIFEAPAAIDLAGLSQTELFTTTAAFTASANEIGWILGEAVLNETYSVGREVIRLRRDLLETPDEIC